MSIITVADVQKISKLARIKITEKEVNHFHAELQKILNWVEQLEQVDTKDIEPCLSVLDIRAPMVEDVISDGYITGKIISNAPNAKLDFFVVPKVVE